MKTINLFFRFGLLETLPPFKAVTLTSPIDGGGGGGGGGTDSTGTSKGNVVNGNAASGSLISTGDMLGGDVIPNPSQSNNVNAIGTTEVCELAVMHFPNAYCVNQTSLVLIEYHH